MIEKQNLSCMLHDWLKKFEEAVSVHNGERMCEASRMVIGVCSLLWAYHPDEFTDEVRGRAQMLLEEAVSCISSDIKEDREKDEYYGMYERNISKRLQTLEELKKEPCIK